MAHDIWDGKRKKILGITIFFTDPETLQTYAIPVVLTPPSDGEKALALSKDSLSGLANVGVVFNDLFRAKNDNCLTAKKLGRL